jgi:hypothetical protein
MSNWSGHSASLTLAFVLGFQSIGYAQSPPDHRNLVAFGGGASRMTATEGGGHAGVLHLHARAAREISPFIGLGVELGVFGLDDEDPLPSDIAIDSNNFLVIRRRPRVLRTTTLTVSARLGGASPFFVRPGIGIGRQWYVAYGGGSATPPQTFTSVQKLPEMGLAASVATGYDLRITPRLQIAFEGIVVWSGGEDSSGARRMLGVQIVPGFRF